MKLIVRTMTQMGPRTTISQELAPADASQLASLATERDGSEVHILTEGRLLNMAEHIQNWRKRSKLRLAVSNPSPAYQDALSRTLDRLERPHAASRRQP